MMFENRNSVGLTFAGRGAGMLALAVFGLGAAPWMACAKSGAPTTAKAPTAQDKLHKQISSLLAPPPPPPLEPGARPTKEMIEKYQAQFAGQLAKAVELAGTFVEKYPKENRVDEVRMHRLRARFTLIGLRGDGRTPTAEAKKLEAEVKALLADRSKVGPLLAGEAAFWGVQADLRSAGLDKLSGEEARQKLIGAMRSYADAHGKHPRAAGIYEQLAQIAESQGDEEQALKYMRLLARNFPDTPQGKLFGGVAYRKEHIGKPVSLELTAIDGRKIDTAKMRGKVIMVIFWATWCPGCIQAMPHEKQLYEKYHDKGLELIGINSDEDKKVLDAFLAKKELPWPQVWQDRAADINLSLKWGARSIPMMLLIDRKGVLVSDDVGKIINMVPEMMGDTSSTENTAAPAPAVQPAAGGGL